MPTPRFNSLFADLARMVQEERATPVADDSKFVYKNQLLIRAVNACEQEFLSKLILTNAKNPRNILIVLPEAIEEEVGISAVGGQFDVSVGDAWVADIAPNVFGLPFYWHTPLDKWYDVAEGKNKEELPTVNNRRWTQIGRKVYILPAEDLTVRALVLKDHEEVVYNGANDIIIPARYDLELLDIAYGYLGRILPQA